MRKVKGKQKVSIECFADDSGGNVWKEGKKGRKEKMIIIDDNHSSTQIDDAGLPPME